jgi:Copper type II ascorbate-dependent monooxygenase, C-terminal domain
MRVVSVAVAVCLGCGGGGTTGTDASGDDQPDAPIGDTWHELIGRDWSIQPGTFDNYQCRRIQVPEETWITSFKALSPVGTHHEILTISDNATPLGDYDCDSGNLDMKMLYAAGIETGDLVFPDGVAMHVKAGQYVNILLHLFDAGDTPLNGHSGVLVKTASSPTGLIEADMTFAGTTNIMIPPGSHQVTGGCAIPADWHVFTLWPHMHAAATSQQVHVNGAMQLNANPYTFTDQKNYPMTMTFHQGDQVLVTCAYNNTTGGMLTYGDSATAEMCFTGMYRYPAPTNGTLYDCVSH